MLAAIDEMLVDLVGDGKNIEFLAEPRDELQLRLGVDLAGRVMRSVDDDGPSS